MSKRLRAWEVVAVDQEARHVAVGKVGVNAAEVSGLVEDVAIELVGSLRRVPIGEGPVQGQVFVHCR